MAATALATLLIALHYGCWARVQSLRTARRSFVIKDDRFVKRQTNQHPVGQRALLARVPRAYWRDRPGTPKRWD